jgi:hypothetical protein
MYDESTAKVLIVSEHLPNNPNAVTPRSLAITDRVGDEGLSP